MVRKGLESFIELESNTVSERGFGPLRVAFTKSGVVHVEIMHQRLDVLVKGLEDATHLVTVEQGDGVAFVILVVTEGRESLRKPRGQFIVFE